MVNLQIISSKSSYKLDAKSYLLPRWLFQLDVFDLLLLIMHQNYFEVQKPQNFWDRTTILGMESIVTAIYCQKKGLFSGTKSLNCLT
jgi:hypothetical protein